MQKIITSSIGKKIVSAITGIGLVLFIVFHLAGNFLLLKGATAFNSYAHFITNILHGAFIYIAEAGLIVFFLVHIAAGVSVFVGKRLGRPDPYQFATDAGGVSRKTMSAKSMVLTGCLLFTFVVLHLLHFKFGPGEKEGYTTMVHGQAVRDVYRLVVEEFNKPWVVMGYIVVMATVGFHVRHGFWSAFQSIGLGSRIWTRVFSVLGIVIAATLVVGLIGLPLYVFFFVDPAAIQAVGTEIHP